MMRSERKWQNSAHLPLSINRAFCSGLTAAMHALYAKSLRFVKCEKSKFEKYILWGVPVFGRVWACLFLCGRRAPLFCAHGGRGVAYHPAANRAGGYGSGFAGAGWDPITACPGWQPAACHHPAQHAQHSRHRAGQTARQAGQRWAGSGIKAGRQARNACTKRTHRAAERGSDRAALALAGWSVGGYPSAPIDKLAAGKVYRPTRQARDPPKCPVSGGIGSYRAFAGDMSKL
jgi:hypothetical protein